MSNHSGRKTKLTEEEVKELIYLYKGERKNHGKVEYKEMYLFNKELVNQGRYPKSAGEDFWRKEGRLGRKIIDQTNKAFSNEISVSSKLSDSIPNFTDIVQKYYDNKDELIKVLLIHERRYYQNVKQRKHLEGKIQNYQSKLEITEKRLDYIQDLLFKLLRYSSNKEVPLLNLLDTRNKSQTIIVKKALEGIFNEPTDFYKWYEQMKSTNEDKKDNVVPLKSERSLADDNEDIF
ncbi:hypothetical protein [Neobacillus muris]|uniref:hypothetical protein n=1 Tax=Neobacillus muris TaxID=2941334 RepID=UPI0020417DD5|nr:hypothetical protein [Neobacillus muris]